MRPLNVLPKKVPFIVLVIFVWAVYGAAEENLGSKTVEFQNHALTIRASDTPLGKILFEIYTKCRVEIKGLESRKDEPISFVSKKGSLEMVLKDLMRYLGEKNYAFEYKNEQLLRISVVPAAKTVPSVVAPSSDEKKENDAPVGAVRVTDIIKASQAQALGLMKGDIILEYDGVKINNTKELVAATQKKSETDQIEMVVLRENYMLRFILQGGFLGVRIVNETVSKPHREAF